LTNIATSICENGAFKLFMTSIIFFNAIMLAYATDYRLRALVQNWKDGMSDELEVSSRVFTLELIMRLSAEELTFFFNDDWKFNLLDCFIVISAIVEILLLQYGQSVSVHTSNFRLVHVRRVMKTFRAVCLIRFFRELRVMLLSLFNSVVSLQFSYAVYMGHTLFLIMFLVGMVIAQGVSDHFLQDTNKPFDEDQTSQLLLKFDSLPRVYLSPLESVTGGDNWSKIWHWKER